MMKTSRHSLLAKGLLVLLSLLILIFTFTYSWFIDVAAPAHAQGLSFTTSVSASFDIAIGFSTPRTDGYVVSDWITDGTIDFTDLTRTVGGTTEHYNLLADYKPVDLTSDGVTLIRPEMLSKNTDINLNKNTYEYALPNQQYITFDLIIRSKTANARVKLGTDSKVLGVDEGADVNLSKLTGSGSSAKLSDYGTFSEDSVVGAVRVSFVGYDDIGATDYSKIVSEDTSFNDDATLLWIPRSDIFLKANSGTTGWVLKTSNSSDWTTANQGSYADDDPSGTRHLGSYKDIASTHYYYGIFENATPTGGRSNYKTLASVSNDGPVVTNLNDAASVPILTTSVRKPTPDEFYYGKCRVNLWVDGCDAEARRAIDNGQFTVTFDLASV